MAIIFNYQQLPRPFFCLAPMDGVTDSAFRQVVANCAKPDLMYTEFVNVEGLNSVKGYKQVAQSLIFNPLEQPLIAQIWGLIPDNFYRAAKIIKQLGFAGIDINMGCPDKKVIKKGSGGALINNPSLAAEIIKAVKNGGEGLPVSVKTRIGFNCITTTSWCAFLLNQQLDALTIHGRTVVEQSLVPAHWDEIGKVVKIRNQMAVSTVIIGNGDVSNLANARTKFNKYQVDGVMIGRGIFQNPWFFNPAVIPSTEDKINLLKKHLSFFQTTYHNQKPFAMLKRFFNFYISGFKGAATLRAQLYACDTIDKAKLIFAKL